jgi:hypothetical protein
LLLIHNENWEPLYMKTIIKQAIERLRAQGPTPPSPCAVDSDGSVRLCAAAAVAAAGLNHWYGPDAAREFEQQLARSETSTALDEAFARLALPQTLCDAVRMYNDSVVGSQRREAIIEYLAKLPEVALN